MEVFAHSPGSEHPDVIEIEGTDRVRLLQLEEDPEGHVWLEEVDEEIDLEITIEESPIHHHHHVYRGRCHGIKVLVRFNGTDYEREFGPSRTIKTVHHWVCGEHEAHLSPVEAAKHVLALPGADHYLEDGVHIGSVAGADCAVLLDLFPRSRFEG
jgi:hypothetical protein